MLLFDLAAGPVVVDDAHLDRMRRQGHVTVGDDVSRLSGDALAVVLGHDPPFGPLYLSCSASAPLGSP
jgi:hypothetical protein